MEKHPPQRVGRVVEIFEFLAALHGVGLVVKANIKLVFNPLLPISRRDLRGDWGENGKDEGEKNQTGKKGGVAVEHHDVYLFLQKRGFLAAIGTTMHRQPILYPGFKCDKNGYCAVSGLCFHGVSDALSVVVVEQIAVRVHLKIGAVRKAHREVVAGENFRSFSIARLFDKKQTAHISPLHHNPVHTIAEHKIPPIGVIRLGAYHHAFGIGAIAPAVRILQLGHRRCFAELEQSRRRCRIGCFLMGLRRSLIARSQQVQGKKYREKAHVFNYE